MGMRTLGTGLGTDSGLCGSAEGPGAVLASGTWLSRNGEDSAAEDPVELVPWTPRTGGSEGKQEDIHELPERDVRQRLHNRDSWGLRASCHGERASHLQSERLVSRLHREAGASAGEGAPHARGCPAHGRHVPKEKPSGRRKREDAQPHPRITGVRMDK